VLVPNLPGSWGDEPITVPLSAALGLPVALCNDARAFAVAEQQLGAARGIDNVVAVTLGTGLGCGIISGGRLVQGRGELGHVRIEGSDTPCGCGLTGCLETVASARAMVRQAREAIAVGQPTTLIADQLTAKAVVDAARAGDPVAEPIVRRAGEALGVALAALVTALGTEVVVIGGGLSSALDLLTGVIEAPIRERGPVIGGCRVVASSLGLHAGAIGAGLCEETTTNDGPPSPMPVGHGAAAQRWIYAAHGVLDRVADQQDVIDAACELCAEAIAADGLVHLFGTGHSRIPLEEMFPRYGSYPGWHPIVELSMTFHTQVVGANGQRQAMFIERVSGLAEQILANFTIGPPDVMMVFSASGRSAVPIEMAMGARERGLKVIAITSLAQTYAGAPTNATGTRLIDHADLVLDLGTPAADAMVAIPGLEEPVGPGSTIANVALVNAIKTGTAERLVARGAMLPVITSESVVGKDRSAELFDGAYNEFARRVAKALRVR
jgi:predicted NBD/HSP70 family sugar kinase/uncharacterized phosphosugar-binding protein